MKKVLYTAILVFGLPLFTPPAHAETASPAQPAQPAQTKEMGDLAREKKLFRNYSGESSNSVVSFCMEGHIFVIVSGNTSNIPSVVQVYEEKSGRVLPKRCN